MNAVWKCPEENCHQPTLFKNLSIKNLSIKSNADDENKSELVSGTVSGLGIHPLFPPNRVRNSSITTEQREDFYNFKKETKFRINEIERT